MARKSVMKHNFASVPAPNIRRSIFNKDHGYTTVIDSDYLYPIFTEFVVPGSTLNVRASFLARLNNLLTPLMDGIYLDTFFFWVPMRLVWEHSKNFFGERTPDPDSSIDYVTPVVTTPGGGFAEGSLFDYFGAPIGVDNLEFEACYSRAYNLIWNEWFRHQAIHDSVTVDVDDGPDTDTDYVLLKRAKRSDYFTSCLPEPQKGDAVDLPLGTEAPVLGIGKTTNTGWGSTKSLYESGRDGTTRSYPTYNAFYYALHADNEYFTEKDGTYNQPYIRADLSDATASTINELRLAFQIQHMLERDSRSGSRYCESVRAHFGVFFPDVRYRPEYLGGGSSKVMVTPVAQTSEDGTTPQANLAGFGTGIGRNHGFVKTFLEHGYIIGLINLRADIRYQQGLWKLLRGGKTRYDTYHPALAHLGEQSVLNEEIYAQGTSADAEVFGYQERWAEYRHKPSLITSTMRSTAGTPLDSWHLAEEFGSLPTLSTTFIDSNHHDALDRCIAVADQKHCYLDIYFDYKAVLPMPVRSIPGYIDHF